jgi:hypothetical protein
MDRTASPNARNAVRLPQKVFPRPLLRSRRRPKIGGFVPSTPLRFFSFFTLHRTLLWLGLAAFALWDLLPMMGSCAKHYLILI